MTRKATADSPISLSETLGGRGVFLLGGTGFLGKVTLAMLLNNFPTVRRVYVMCRAGSGTSSEERFWSDVVGSPVFNPLRDRYGDRLDGFIRDKVSVVGGDITRDHLGYEASEAQAIADDIDVVINSSGKVTFNPALDQSMRTNVNGTRNILAFVRRMKRPALVHVSTCFTAGTRTGQVWESEPLAGYFPRRDELPGVTFSPEQEIEDCMRLCDRIREEAKDAVHQAMFLDAARERLLSEHRDPDNPRYLKLAQARERKNWVRSQLADRGVERAKKWGWPNIYTYTKSLGDQLVAQADDIVRAIVKPSVVESSVSFPFAGWNEGFTTTAPLIFLALKGQNLFLADEELILDLTPVDYIAGGLLSIAAQACIEQPKLVYQLASGDTNPINMRRVITLLGLHKRKHFQQRKEGNRFLNEVIARMEARPADAATFDRTSVPMINRLAGHASRTLDKIRPRWGGGKFAEVIDKLKTGAERVDEVTRSTSDAFDMYRPFTLENRYEFRTDHIRQLQARLSPEDRELAPWKIADLDWHHWWMDIHLPGLHEHVLPELEEDFASKPRSVFAYNHLVELFETASKLHQNRVALRIDRDGHHDQYTYEELHELAQRVAINLRRAGVQSGDHVMLLSENRPEWVMCYFGVIKAGATCVPVDKELTADEVANLARASEARAIIVSDARLADNCQGLAERLDSTEVLRFRQAFEQLPLPEERSLAAELPVRSQSNAVASLIFTSGTTGQPKGVMLTHRNLTYMTSELASIFDIGAADGVLSVLPLHHTFEFSAGLLLPLARGATITYLEEVTGPNLSSALDQGHITAIVGVPALWELLHRRIRNQLAEAFPGLDTGMEWASQVQSWIRNHTPINLGHVLFWPVHKKLGGRIRYLISGGSALSPDVKQFFHGLGFPLLEGYGLTEASPVITVTRPQNKLNRSSVGTPLPHVDVKIIDPDERGVGEVAARGSTIMAGYYKDEEATAHTLRDHWLHTGDLGYLDDDRNLYLVGRSKDVIVDSNGKNVYPDELEETYATHDLIKELSVVGLPEGTSERVACLIVPDYEAAESRSRDAVQAEIRQHIRSLSAGLPLYKRIKILHFWDADLPRTATRKVKRNEVIAELNRLHQLTHAVTSAREATTETSSHWLSNLVAGVTGKAASEIGPTTRLDALGFDSLMYAELTAAIEAGGASVAGIGDMASIGTVAELSRLLDRPVDEGPSASEAVEEINVPPLVAKLGRTMIDRGHRLVYEHMFRTTFTGQVNVPAHTNFIIAPNHSSHIDIGLIKTALGDAAKNMCALAATDYFFDTRLKRAYFENFTRLVPMDRSGSLRKSLQQALDVLAQGYNLLLFPEGTRSVSGEIQPFKASLGYLALHAQVGILPVYLSGTFDALPKGGRVIKQRDVGATIGKFLSYETLRSAADSVPRTEANRFVSTLVQRHVEAMRDGQREPNLGQILEGLRAGPASQKRTRR